jgi:hypothetical protein
MVDSVAGCPALPCPSISTVISFAAMAYVPRTEGTRLVQVEGIEGTYPFYGSIRTEPREAWERLQSGRNVIVDPSLLAALNARAGDSLALGEARFVITGTIVDVPGDVGVRTAFGPRVYVAGQQLAATGLLVADPATITRSTSRSARAILRQWRIDSGRHWPKNSSRSALSLMTRPTWTGRWTSWAAISGWSP